MKTLGLVLATVFFLSVGLSATYADQSSMNASSQRVASAKETSMTKEKESYQKKMQQELNGYKKDLKQLEAKSKNLEEKTKMEVKDEMADLHKKMETAEARLKSMKSGMKSASGEAWDKMKSETDSAMQSVKESYDKVAAHFK